MRDYPHDSPTEKRRKELPRGAGDWPGHDKVWSRLQEAAHTLARGRYTWLGHDHIETMAIMGSGHEETMKAHMAICLAYGWCKY